MRTISFTVPCNAIYKGSLEIEDDFLPNDFKDVSDLFEIDNALVYKLLDIINSRLSEVNVDELEWLSDSEVEDIDIYHIGKHYEV